MRAAFSFSPAGLVTGMCETGNKLASDRLSATRQNRESEGLGYSIWIL